MMVFWQILAFMDEKTRCEKDENVVDTFAQSLTGRGCGKIIKANNYKVKTDYIVSVVLEQYVDVYERVAVQ